MSLQSGYIAAPGSSLFKSDAQQKHSLGVKVTANDGREFRYVSAGADIAAGKLVQSSAEHANHESLAPTADVAINATTLTVTLGATAVVANEYATGFLVVTNTPGLGMMYEIDSHPAAIASATCALKLKDKIRVALTTAASKVDLVHNPYKDVVTMPTTWTGAPVGVTTCALTSGEFGWVCVKGATSLLSDGGNTIGQVMVASNAAAGAVEAVAAATTEPYPPVCYALTTGTDQEYPAVFVTIG